MDEQGLIALWPAMLAWEDALTLGGDLTALREQREKFLRDIDGRIAATESQLARRTKITEPLLSNSQSEVAIRFWPKVRVIADEDSCWVYTGYTRDRRNEEYGSFKTSAERTELAHRVAFGLMHPDELMPPVVLHSCDNPPCCRPKHLIAGTQADNVADATRKGRMRGKTHQAGEANDSAVLTNKIVIEARRRYSMGESVGKLAEAFGVAQGTLQGALSGNTWAHIDAVEPPITGRRSGSHLSEDDVRTIRATYAKMLGENPERGRHGRVCIELAAQYGGMTAANIHAIVRRKSWAHVE
jgi:hypothetical protein